MIIEIKSSNVIYIMILCFISRQIMSGRTYCPKQLFLYCFARKKFKKSKNTVLGYKKGSKMNSDNRNEILRGDFYYDSMLHFAPNHVWKNVLSKTVFSFITVLGEKSWKNWKLPFQVTKSCQKLFYLVKNDLEHNYIS